MLIPARIIVCALVSTASPIEDVTQDPGGSHASTQTIYLNFDGGTLGGGGDDAPSNQSALCSGSFPAYEVNENRDAVIQAVMNDFASHDVRVVSARPQDGSYTMAMIGPASHCGAGVGRAVVDCANANPNNIALIYLAGNEYGPGIQAAFISHELGHTFGLDHITGGVDTRGAIMTATIAGSSDPEFMDFCAPIDGDNYCSSQHQNACGSGGQQGSVAELGAVLGERGADALAPEVTLVTPSQGDRFDQGDEVRVQADATDDHEVYELYLLLDGTQIATDVASPHEWVLTGLEEGGHQIEVLAVDLAGNEGTSGAVGIVVGVGEAPEPDPGETDGTGSDDEGTTGEDEAPGEEPGSDPCPWCEDEGATDGGCTVPGSVPLSGLLVPLLIGAGRLRRRR
jgi:hypothetical protein